MQPIVKTAKHFEGSSDTADMLKSEEKSSGTPPTRDGAVGARRLDQARPAGPREEATVPRTPILWRLRVAGRLLLDLRKPDFQAAAVFVRAKYPNQPRVIAWLRFVGWALNQMLVQIPPALRHTSFERPISRTPIWLLDPNPLANHPWAKNPQATLPAEAGTVVIGAGFTGSSLAYHWSQRAPSNATLIVMEMDDPASGSSGRNQGVIVMGRYFKMVHGSVLKHLKTARQELTADQQGQLAWQFADRYCRAAYRNADLIEQTIYREQIDCRYARKGWIQAREADEQVGLGEAVRMALESGYTDWTSLTPEEVERHCGMRVHLNAGFSTKAATWHPAKWVWGILGKALQSPNIQLFTRTKVTRVEDAGDHYVIHTERGSIRAQNMVYATETYTPKLDSRLHDAILPIQEQAACGDGGPENMLPDVGISSSWFFSGRAGGRVTLGSGGGRLPDEEAGRNWPSRFLTKFVAGQLYRLFGPYTLRITNEWSGTTGYSPDEYPIIGLLDGKRQHIIGGMCGSGSGVAFNAARCVVNRILGQTGESDDYPEEYFAPSRLLSPQIHRWPEIDPPTGGSAMQ